MLISTFKRFKLINTDNTGKMKITNKEEGRICEMRNGPGFVLASLLNIHVNLRQIAFPY